ncbi:MAG: T9SS type B sorting domain-containing protein [Bacteroidetes bacterium]|nr:MAG: T9SS type B sorting domain-containing protein [Bacteroidota bacterium]
MNKRCLGKLHYSLLSIVLLFSSVLLHAQTSNYNTTTWRFSNPTPMGATFTDLDYFDNNTALATSSDGCIAKTTNGGTNWTYGAFTFTTPAGLVIKPVFNDVHFVTSTVAYAVGTPGCMVKTTDGGTTWSFVNTPLYANSKSINAVWFIDANKGYIGGQWNTLDSIPKLYVTNNGGATWDSLAAPGISGTTKVGFVNNATYPGIDYPVDAKAKEIFRITFLNNSIGYISGGGNSTIFPTLPIPNITSTATCAFTGTQTTGSTNASLLWKFDNGTLIDYSISKERLGYTGYPALPLNCTSKFGTVNQTVQQYRALNIINDSLIVMMSFNNNIVIRVRTGKNDSTQNINRPGVYEKGRYEVLNTGPSGPPPGYPVIPAIQVLNASNPYQMLRAADGKLYANGNFGRLWTSVDTGRNWVQQNCLPANTNFNQFAVWAMDITPGGKFYVMGQAGVMADSTTGGVWRSDYKFVAPGAGYVDFEFADCNNGIASGGPSITVTQDGGKTWIDRNRPDFQALNIQITGVVYPAVNKAYFSTSVGNLYRTTDQAQTMDPLFANNLYQLNDVAAIGNDTIWATAYSAFTIPAANRTTTILRSIDNGATFQTFGGFPVGSTSPNLSRMSFSSRNVGYIAGTRNGVYKTIDGGATWTSINPFPSLNEGPTGFPNTFITYTEIFALNDNTVFVIGNMFTSTGIKRVYKTTDGGANWTDITGNIPALLPVGNLIGLMAHDANNLYVTAGSSLFKTTDGGANWIMDLPPAGGIFETMAFAPKTVPAAIPFANRKLFVSGVGGAGTLPPIMEYGSPFNVNVNSTETVTNATCTNLTAGSITINATGGLAPYTYSINGGAFQSSNLFTGLTQGPKTITVKDAFCGTLTKTVTVGFTDNLVLTTNRDTAVCSAQPVPMLASTNGTGASFAWTPTAGLSNPGISNPVATVTANAAYTVTATLNGCVRSNTVNILIRPVPIISAGPDKTIVDGDQVTLEGAAIAPVFMTWTPSATLTFANTLNPVAKPNITTIYTLLVRNGENCTSTDDMVVTVIPYCAKVMDAFTPNGDGTNDRWIVSNGTACYTQVSVSVFNRYGGEVYKNANYQNNWEGTYNSKPVADGTYYYVVTYKLINGRSITLKGDVTILR